MFILIKNIYFNIYNTDKTKEMVTSLAESHSVNFAKILKIRYLDKVLFCCPPTE